MTDFIKTYHSLKKPKSESEYSSSEPINDSILRIGKNFEERPVLLINPGGKVSMVNYPLKYINIENNVTCKISENDKKLELDLTIIELKLGGDTLIEYFLEISQTIFSKLSTEDSVKDFENVFKEFIRIFQKLNNPPLKTIQGLWSEMLFILNSKDSGFFIEKWHSDINQVFDFVLKNDGVEVKSTRSDNRIHSFSLKQLNPSNNLNLIIVSIIVSKSVNYGKSIMDLYKEISKVINTENKLKLMEVISETLGENFTEGVKVKFDYESALDSIKYYNYKDLPKIDSKNVPQYVSGVRFNSDLNEVESIDIKSLSKKDNIFSKI